MYSISATCRPQLRRPLWLSVGKSSRWQRRNLHSINIKIELNFSGCDQFRLIQIKHKYLIINHLQGREIGQTRLCPKATLQVVLQRPCYTLVSIEES